MGPKKIRWSSFRMYNCSHHHSNSYHGDGCKPPPPRYCDDGYSYYGDGYKQFSFSQTRHMERLAQYSVNGSFFTHTTCSSTVLYLHALLYCFMEHTSHHYMSI